MPIPAVLGAVGRVAAAGGRAGGSANLVKLGNELGQLQFAADSAGGAIKTLATAFVPLAPHVALAAAGLNIFKDAIGSIGNAIGGFVKLASPIHVVKFQMAMEDMTATFGKMLIPVMEYATRLVRFFTDILWKLSDPIQRLMSALMKPLIQVMDLITENSGGFIDSLILIIDVFTLIARGAATMAEAVIEGIKGVMAFLDPIFNSLGLGAKTKNVKDSSVGAAARPASIGSVEDYGKKAIQAAFSLGTAGKKAEDRTASGIEEIVRMLTNFPSTVVDKTVEAISAGAAKVVDTIKTLPTDIATAILSGAPGKETVKDIVKGGEEKAAMVKKEIAGAAAVGAAAFENTTGISLPDWLR